MNVEEVECGATLERFTLPIKTLVDSYHLSNLGKNLVLCVKWTLIREVVCNDAILVASMKASQILFSQR